ncbi:tryptophan synthase subunit beta [Capnocytophaga stomatis]|uniref:tryptophan synthase subunit beta n=1 Tax=Capnocytophaga stomatis TaxID=1848904 RepID=UPI001AD3496D|nr:tryptophan synthase subunit beta [Capnocytophaga stomatis]GIM50243.1 tryptophan synthase beta chain 2 [Capnocytophaga stomatis]
MEKKYFEKQAVIKVSPLAEMLNYQGYYGEYGGTHVPPMLEAKLKELSDFFDKITKSEAFQEEFVEILKDFVGRPSSLYFAKNLSDYVGSKIYLKREDLNHTGSHKINNAIGQILVAKKMGAKEIIAETGAGQHGVATATVCAFLGLKCKIFMGAVDMNRQALNVRRMQMLGAEVIACTSGNQTLKDAVDTALNYYIENPESYYLLGSHVGPHPYPKMVGYFQSVIGNEARQQILQKEGRLPDSIVACLGGGSNAIGLFSAFLEDKDVKIYGAEGGGEDTYQNTAATLNYGKPIVFQGTYSYCLVDDKGTPIASKSIAAGLDYPGISPQHAYLKDTKRVEYHSVTDKEAIEAYKLLSRLEGITPAIESSHAVALAMKLMKNKNQLVIVNLSGRGDKDLEREV